jgi:hypothetical protein
MSTQNAPAAQAEEYQAEELPNHLRLDPSRVRDAEFAFKVKQVTVPYGTPPERVMDPQFWSQCLHLFTSAADDQARHLVLIDWPEHPTWFAMLRVVGLGPKGMQLQRLLAIISEDEEQLGGVHEGPVGTNAGDFEVKPLGPGQGYVAVRKHDQREIHRSMNRAHCFKAITDHLEQARKGTRK